MCPVISYCVLALQVDNAAARGASAVLIYPDTKDYNYNKDTPLYGHVRLQSHKLLNHFPIKMEIYFL